MKNCFLPDVNMSSLFFSLFMISAIFFMLRSLVLNKRHGEIDFTVDAFISLMSLIGGLTVATMGRNNDEVFPGITIILGVVVAIINLFVSTPKTKRYYYISLVAFFLLIIFSFYSYFYM